MNVTNEVRQAREAMIAAIKEDLAPDLFRHTVVLARTPLQPNGPPQPGLQYFVGTGTLTQVDTGERSPRYGVLTCGHVLGELERAIPGTRHGSLSLMVASNISEHGGSPRPATIPYDRERAVIEGRSNTGWTGPDLAWLPLSQEQAHALQNDAQSRAVFYNLTEGLRSQDRYKSQGRVDGPRSDMELMGQHVYIAVGWNHEIHARSVEGRSGIWMNEVMPENITASQGWLYADYRINDDNWIADRYEDGTMLPASWQGLSGGAIWHVWQPDPNIEQYEKMLAGVVFYEIPQSADRAMTIRAHFDLSLLRLLHRACVAPPGAITEEEIVEALRELPAPSSPPLR